MLGAFRERIPKSLLWRCRLVFSRSPVASPAASSPPRIRIWCEYRFRRTCFLPGLFAWITRAICHLRLRAPLFGAESPLDGVTHHFASVKFFCGRLEDLAASLKFSSTFLFSGLQRLQAGVLAYLTSRSAYFRRKKRTMPLSQHENSVIRLERSSVTPFLPKSCR